MLTEDLDLQPADITALADRAAIGDLITRLGYDTARARETFPDAEGMSERLQEAVRHMQLLAEDDLGLTVYLIELTSVTVARIQELAAHFRQRPVDVMLVLTTPDYRRLDFVLFDSPREGDTAAGRAAPVIPRRFTFNRAAPSPERLRVIRRFLRRLTWTEPDGIAQWDKLKSAFSIAQWSEEFFDNRGLFADYYLKHRLPEDPAWNDPTLRDAREQMQQDFLAARGRFLQADETTVRAELLEPMLRRLGFNPRPCAPSAEGAPRAPDYELLDPDSGDVLAVCMAYPWDRPLDGPATEERDPRAPEENPGAAVLDLFTEGREWAIVTNGKHWRLYTAKTESRATNFYQVDAEEAAADVADAFRYFRLMFQAQAFRPCEAVIAGEPATACFLEQLLDGSRKYAREVGDRLKGRVFQDIFPILAEGFIRDIRHREGDGASLDEDRLALAYNATLALLYRLLFLLYAESRDLLPVAEVGGYWEKSLTALKEEIAAAARTVEDRRDERLAAVYADDPQQDALWRRLTDLFTVIGDGEPGLNVPRYNGGLFLTDPEEGVEEYERTLAAFLNDHALSDLHLARAIDRLARDPDEKNHGLAMIDFKSLGVRQLGSIYEGLLEFQVRIASERMAVCSQKGREVVMPYDEAVKATGVTIKRKGRGGDAPEEVIAPGEVFLANSKDERKASGSYYTPEYIVKYIVEHTVGPVLEEKLDALRDDLNRACADYRRHRQSLEAQGKDAHDGLLQSDLERRVIQHCFDLSVLDPAMGSGHFLVTAVDFIADRLIRFLNGFPNNPVERMLNDTRRAILKHAGGEGIVLDEARLTPINLLKRHVLKRCIYGVDLNPMAVELAKVSLWLHCFTLGAPLSFLDHHLKCGNSLIGEASTAQARPDGQAALDGTSRWHDFARAVQNYLIISRLEDATIEQVTASRKSFREAEAILRPHREELNTLTAGFFVEPKSEKKRATWTGLAQLAATEEGRRAREQAQQLAAQHRFFHWPLEFPDQWYKLETLGAEVAPKEEGEAGFDAVVGNPPYDELSEHALGRELVERPLLVSRPEYAAALGGRLNWFDFFVVRAISCASSGARHAFIVPMSLMGDWFSRFLRAHLLRERRIVQVEAFPQKDDPERRVFRDAKLPTCAYVVAVSGSTEEFGVRVHPGRDIDDGSPTYVADLPTIEALDETSLAIPLVDEGGWALLRAISQRQWLGKMRDCGATPSSGEIVFNAAFRKYLTDDARETLVLRGGHVQRYHVIDDPKQGEPVYIRKEAYLRDASPDSSAHHHAEARVVYQECAALDNWRRVIATLMPAGAFCGHKICYFMDYKCSKLALLAVYNSRLVEWLVRALSVTNSLPAYLIGAVPFPRFRHEALPSLEPLMERLRAVSESDGVDVVTTADEWLALLAQRMMDLNRDKHAEIQRFVKALEESLGFDVEKMTRKTHIKGYHEGDFERLEAALAANRRRLSQPAEGMFAARLRGEYEASMGVLGPLETALRETDELIDAIVYRLYGLTAEEVEVVEGEGESGA